MNIIENRTEERVLRIGSSATQRALFNGMLSLWFGLPRQRMKNIKIPIWVMNPLRSSCVRLLICEGGRTLSYMKMTPISGDGPVPNWIHH